MKDDSKHDLLLASWSMALMRRAFTDLAASFAVVDARAADQAIRAIEGTVAAEMLQLAVRPPPGIEQVPAEGLAVLDNTFRRVMEQAREDVRQLSKPRN